MRRLCATSPAKATSSPSTSLSAMAVAAVRRPPMAAAEPAASRLQVCGLQVSGRWWLIARPRWRIDRSKRAVASPAPFPEVCNGCQSVMRSSSAPGSAARLCSVAFSCGSAVRCTSRSERETRRSSDGSRIAVKGGWARSIQSSLNTARRWAAAAATRSFALMAKFRQTCAMGGYNERFASPFN